MPARQPGPGSRGRRRAETRICRPGCSTVSNRPLARASFGASRRSPAAGAAARAAGPRSSSGVSNRSKLGRRRPGSRGAGRRSRSGGKSRAAGTSPVRRLDQDTAGRMPRPPRASAPARRIREIQFAQRHHSRRRAAASAVARSSSIGRSIAASTTQSTVSSGASRQITGSSRLRTMSAGSATPLVSITMPSGTGSRRSSRSRGPQQVALQRAADAAILQADHAVACPSISSASMLMAPKSLTTAAIRRPSACRQQWFTTVVLPAPRKPATRRMGPAR
jgi:hypothetical protein